MKALPKTLQEAIDERDSILEWMASAKEREMHLRKFIAAQLFPAPVEGSNLLETSAGVVSLKHSIDRKVDVAAFTSLKEELRRAAVPLDTLIDWKPSLVLKQYRLLKGLKLKLFDRVLTIKEGTPTLEIKPVQ